MRVLPDLLSNIRSGLICCVTLTGGTSDGRKLAAVNANTSVGIHRLRTSCVWPSGTEAVEAVRQTEFPLTTMNCSPRTMVCQAKVLAQTQSFQCIFPGEAGPMQIRVVCRFESPRESRLTMSSMDGLGAFPAEARWPLLFQDTSHLLLLVLRFTTSSSAEDPTITDFDTQGKGLKSNGSPSASWTAFVLQLLKSLVLSLQVPAQGASKEECTNQQSSRNAKARAVVRLVTITTKNQKRLDLLSDIQEWNSDQKTMKMYGAERLCECWEEVLVTGGARDAEVHHGKDISLGVCDGHLHTLQLRHGAFLILVGFGGIEEISLAIRHPFHRVP
ncbi:hypothetical protein KCU90_g148, partial [Aureobasidium melanogenum]